jgi:hypothetical protein
MKKIFVHEKRNRGRSGWLVLAILIVLFIIGIITGLIFAKSLIDLC